MRDRAVGSVGAAKILGFDDPEGSGRRKVVRMARSQRHSLCAIGDDGTGERTHLRFAVGEVERFRVEREASFGKASNTGLQRPQGLDGQIQG